LIKKYKLFDGVLTADSEYHVHFVQKSLFDSENLKL
jgi:hypothetical protein